MGYFKKQNLAIYLLISFLFLVNCNDFKTEKRNITEQYNEPMDKKMQLPRFDIDKYEANLKKNPDYDGYQKDPDTYVKQYHSIKEGYIEEKFEKSIVENYVEQLISNNRFETFQIYDKGGFLLSVTHYFADNIEIGQWLYYKDEKLVKTEDKDKNFQFSLDKVLEYGKKNNVDFTKSGKLSRFYSKTYGTYIYELQWNTGKKSADIERSLFRKVVLDGSNGKELKSEEYYINPLAR